ncbi:MAG: acylphosphatase [Cyclobacteriaceae bacterium]
MKKNFTINISGEVQGVFFRASTKEIAESLKIYGLVKNESDGSVYVEAEGEEEALKEFIRWCHHGPPRANVEQCDVREASIKNFSRFVIER